MNNPAYIRAWLMRQLPQEGLGPCAKQTVVAIVEALDGRTFGGTNACRNPQRFCPREEQKMATGEGYELCRSMCDQVSHAEVTALKAAGEAARGGVLRVYGHSYACQSCKDAAQRAGIADLVVGGGFVRLNRFVPRPGNMFPGSKPSYEPV